MGEEVTAAVGRGVTLDTGALIAAEANDAEFRTAWERAISGGVRITRPAVVLAQAWRSQRQARMARAVKRCRVSIVDEVGARAVGELLAVARAADVVDAAVVIDALRRHDEVWTSDPDDLHLLASAVSRKLRTVVL
jgi:predicted nucleic acid-binding protein